MTLVLLYGETWHKYVDGKRVESVGLDYSLFGSKEDMLWLVEEYRQGKVKLEE